MMNRLSLAAALVLAPVAAQAEPVLLISIDGLRPVDVINADEQGLQVPNLRRFLKEGSYASGVRGVLPTITYPSHTTLLTGASPARHGIVGNTTFDPTQINQGGWFWYASDTKADTLWEAAARAGRTTGNVHWPVSVGASAVRWNLPQIWRTGHSDDAKLLTALSTPGLVAELEHGDSHYAAGIDESITGDENRGDFAIKLIEAHKPDFTTVYLTALDHEQHAEGPDSAPSKAVLERIDAIVGKLIAAQMTAHPDAVIAVASDHGFASIDTEVNLFRAFIDAGLIAVNATGKVTGWQAMPWPSGGSAAIVLANPDDAALTARVAAVLEAVKADPMTKVEAILDRAAIVRAGANPQASFYVTFRPGATAGSYKGAATPLISVPAYKGTHGYSPDLPEMRSTFLLMGKGIKRGRNLGEIDMRAIAPTLAAIMGVTLNDAEVAPIAR